MLITLSGLDGAGKSTLAEALRASLAKDGIPAVIYHINWQLGLYAVLRKARSTVKRLARGSPQLEQRAGATGRSTLPEWQRRLVWSKGLRRCVDLIDLGGFALYLLYVEKVLGRVLIMDRYFYDRLTDLADGRHWAYARLFARLIPTPDVPVFVRVDPQVAFERKGERSVEAMTRRESHFAIIFGWVPNAVEIDNDRLDRATEELRAIVLARTPKPRDRRLALEQ